ncbi:HAMP domain-containing sensor histidine kinase [Sporosarcina sp. Te-1]|uniref:HAMP domain-containing sensor histidine kinase n=1 Tax=Sporosarcina sp. Te-1 TaxID=2818390 RepID=UPI001A9E8EDB|nr:HAMP domain-containing sensor histidine kinase [Sporosarcina sp. Te-1]QTD39494.1 HAMP domain-containing histidine kinase [Sporosarcina sp. Te-1]
MKIKTWLLLSYFIVMLLPLGAAYGLFAWINSYHHDRHVTEYMDSRVELNAVQSLLTDPSLYRPDADWSKVEELATDQLSITLYTHSGFMLYSSNPIKLASASFTEKDKLYKDFYNLRQTFNRYTYKEPVFSGTAIAGIYEIEWIRDEWVTGVEERTWFVTGIFAAFFILLFGIVTLLVNRKLNKPLYLLMGQMDSFAKGRPVQSMAKRKDEIGELAESFETMRKELDMAKRKLAAEQQQREFMIASISHDLKTPLTSIRAYAEALQAGSSTVRDQQEYHDIIIAKSNYMRQMLDDLLMYTLLQSSTYEMELVPVDGEEFFEMLVSGYETLCDEKQIDLSVMCDVIGEYTVNSKQLTRVVDNLMSNAIAHTEPGGTIGLAAVQTGKIPDWCFDFVKLALGKKEGMFLIVQNMGTGLAEEEMEHVFNPLYQADQARTKAGERGTGLGLSITKQIIEKHNGTVQMVSVRDIGTAVICWLPQRKGEEVQ